jgi:hypothetical protein
MSITLRPTADEISDDPDLESLRFTALVYLVLFNALDLLLTRHLLANAPGSREGNGFMALIITSNWAYLVKLGVPIGFGFAKLSAPLMRSTTKWLVAACWIYTAVVLWNLHLVWIRG